MFLNSGDEAASILELLEYEYFLSSAPVACLLAEHSLVDSLEDIRLLNLSRGAPVAWLLLCLLFFHRHSPD